MLDAQSYLNLIHDRGRERKPLERVYRNIRRKDLFLSAYGKLYANQGALTDGVNLEDTIDGMSLERIDSIIETLEKGSYQWTPVKRTHIPKANGKQRPVGIPGWKDKMVQEVLRQVLEAYYEPQFSDHSHGFRPGRSCHTALTEIKETWKGTRWFIEGDIKGCFDNINHENLCGLIENNVKDDRLMKLLREMLKAGYMEKWVYHETFSGTPQGGVLSPLLSNIYLNELDEFVERELMPKYNRGDKRQMNPAYTWYRDRRTLAKKQGDKKRYKELTPGMYQHPARNPMDANYRRLRYVRYADDFLLGFEGPKDEAEAIKESLKEFLATKLDLHLSEEKTLITNAKEKPAKFLGYNVHIAWDDTKQTKQKDGYKRRAINGLPMLRVPQEVQRRWLQKFMEKGKPERKAALINMTDYDIVMWYQTQWLGLLNYYQMAVNVGGILQQVKWTMEVSLVKTLANKHKRSVKNIYEMYRYKPENGTAGIRVTLETEKRTLVATFGTKPIQYRRVVTNISDNQFQPHITETQLSDRLKADVCELCGSTEKVQVHHVRKLADIREKVRKGQKPQWMLAMVANRRKTLVVCYTCHREIHDGKYDG